jgi:hypothetical protein
VRLTDLELERVRRNRPVYEQVEALAGAPWRMLAAIHYEESSCRTASPGPGGPFQMDPPPSAERLQTILGRYNLPVRAVEEDFLTAAVVAADHLQGKVRGRLQPGTTDEALIKDAFWGYNGRAYGSADNSPYVANDPPRRVLRVRGTVIAADGRRIRVDTPYRKHGAIFVYRELLEVFPPEGDTGVTLVIDDGDEAWRPWHRDQTRKFVAYSDVRGRKFKYARSCAGYDSLLADWVPELPRAGRYRVSVFVPGVHATTRQALYIVRGVVVDGRPVERIASVDQLAASDTWVVLDEFDLDPAVEESGVVRLTNYSPEAPETQIAFDAVKWVLLP